MRLFNYSEYVSGAMCISTNYEKRSEESLGTETQTSADGIEEVKNRNNFAHFIAQVKSL